MIDMPAVIRNLVSGDECADSQETHHIIYNILMAWFCAICILVHAVEQCVLPVRQ